MARTKAGAKAARKFRLPRLPRDYAIKDLDPPVEKDYAIRTKAASQDAMEPTPPKPRPTKKWKSLLKAAAKFCDESVESDYATMELDPPVEKNFISATIADDDEGGWEVLVLGYEWRRGRPKFKYIIIERENDKDSNPNTKTATRGGGGAVDGVQD